MPMGPRSSRARAVAVAPPNSQSALVARAQRMAGTSGPAGASGSHSPHSASLPAACGGQRRA
eukprot:6663258-Prymnesium_polylepis.1